MVILTPSLHPLPFLLSSLFTSALFHRCRSVLNGCPNLADLNLASCRGVPRGIKRQHQGESLRNLSQRIVDVEQESSESEWTYSLLNKITENFTESAFFFKYGKSSRPFLGTFMLRCSTVSIATRPNQTINFPPTYLSINNKFLKPS